MGEGGGVGVLLGVSVVQCLNFSLVCQRFSNSSHKIEPLLPAPPLLSGNKIVGVSVGACLRELILFYDSTAVCRYCHHIQNSKMADGIEIELLK